MVELEIAERDGFGIATVMARKGVSAAEVAAALGVAAPDRPGIAGNEDLSLVGTGPGVWLALVGDGDAAWTGRLRQRLSGVAHVSDQSGGYAIFAMRGKDARTLLQRGAFIDLDACSFGPGSAATTVIAHIGATLWQLDDAPSYEVAVFRSYAASFRDWIAAARAGSAKRKRAEPGENSRVPFWSMRAYARDCRE